MTLDSSRHHKAIEKLICTAIAKSVHSVTDAIQITEWLAAHLRYAVRHKATTI